MTSTFVDLAWDTESVQTVLKAERPAPSEKLQPMGPKGLRTLTTSVSHSERQENAANYSDTKLVDFRR
jgi:hypothetical protein